MYERGRGKVTYQNFLIAGVFGRVFEIHADQMPRQSSIVLLVDPVQYQVNEIEPRQQRGRKINVLRDGQVRVVFTPDRVRRGQDARSSVQGRDDPRFGDGDGLLLHDFVQDRAGGVGHLVELVDAADAAVGEDEGAGFEHHLPRFRVSAHVRGQANGGGTFAAGVDATRGDSVDVAQDLGFGCGRVTAEEDIDIAAVFGAAAFREGFVRAAEQLQQDPFLDIVHFVDAGREGSR